MSNVADTILADTSRTTTREAILQRTTRGMLTFNTGKVHRLEGELWAVPSTRGGFHQVDLSREECDCEDFTFYGRERGVACRHVYAAAIARASEVRRRRRRVALALKVLMPFDDEEGVHMH